MPKLKQSYRQLGEDYFQASHATVAPDPKLLVFNHALANELDLFMQLDRPTPKPDMPESYEIFAGNQLEQHFDPIATAYAGHQFGHFNPVMGDGRALLLGDVTSTDAKGVAQTFDLQLKGAGITPYSRNGDGKATASAVLREYLVSEAMHAMGIPTTRALAATTTGLKIWREFEHPAAVLTRSARSLIRIGHFQFFALQGDIEGLQSLVTFSLQRAYPEYANTDTPALTLLQQVIKAQAQLIAQWQSVGFIHGVMNTDNAAISGETIDYGPCAFMDHFNPGQVFSSIDRQGRYAYNQQAPIGLWNLTRLAECLLPLLDEDEKAAVIVAKQALSSFQGLSEAAHLQCFASKLGIENAMDEDALLISDWLALMATAEADFTLSFHYLSTLNAETYVEDATLATLATSDLGQLFSSHLEALSNWLMRWEKRRCDDYKPLLQQHNPLVIPRNHLLEAALNAYTHHQDLSAFEALLQACTQPFVKPKSTAFMLPPTESERVSKTFCNT